MGGVILKFRDNLDLSKYSTKTSLLLLALFKRRFSNVCLCLDIAGIPLPHNLSGYSLMPLLSEKADETLSRSPHPTWILSEFHGCNVNSSTYMLRTDKWKYIVYSNDHSIPPQLFGILTTFTLLIFFNFSVLFNFKNTVANY